MSEFSKKLERSSLGSRNAQAARRSVPKAVATKVVGKAASSGRRTSSKESGG